MTFLIAIISFLIGLIAKDFLPGYMKEKGKNVATKEDIAKITEKTEEVKTVFQQEIAVFSNELTFRNDYAFKRYSLLYTELYAIVIQSEYIRFFYKERGQVFDFENYPFLETQISEVKDVMDVLTGKTNREVVNVIKDITSANKKTLYELIIRNGQYASPKLLKIATSYRFAYGNYSGTKKLNDEALSEAFDTSEIALLSELIQTIIKEYNDMRKTVSLSYSESELQTGRLEHTYFQ